MSKTILVAGYGPGISKGVAERFGKEGFSVSLAARNTERLQSGVKALEALGIKAQAFPTDLSKPGASGELVKQVQGRMGPISVIHWNAYALGAGDLTQADLGELRTVLDMALVHLMGTVQAALADLKSQKGAVLVTNGYFGVLDPEVDALAVTYNAMGLAIANAAKSKLVRILFQKLKAEGVYAGEVVVAGTVKGTAWDKGNGTLEGSTVAARFWEIYQARREASVVLRG